MHSLRLCKSQSFVGIDAGQTTHMSHDVVRSGMFPHPLHRETTVAFGQALSVLVAQQGQMDIGARTGQGKQRSQITLGSGGEQQVVATHHFRNAQQRIVNSHGQLIRPRPVAPPHHEIATMSGQVDGLRPVDFVNKMLYALCRTGGIPLYVKRQRRNHQPQGLPMRRLF